MSSLGAITADRTKKVLTFPNRLAEKARTLVHLRQTGGLSTLSRKQPGWPFGSVMPYGLDDQGQPSF